MPSDTPTPPVEPQDQGPTLPGSAAVTSRGGLFWLVAVSLVIIDQAVKAIVRGMVGLYESQALVPGVVDLVHVRNEGVAFGLFNGLDLRYKWALTTTLALAALGGIVFYARHIRPDEWYARLGLSMILGGACGNLIDRLTVGYVLDFVDVYVGTWHFWAFNVADASISVGAVLVFLDLLVRPHASRSV
jgi:signal peptidase II